MSVTVWNYRSEMKVTFLAYPIVLSETAKEYKCINNAFRDKLIMFDAVEPNYTFFYISGGDWQMIMTSGIMVWLFDVTHSFDVWLKTENSDTDKHGCTGT